MDDGDGVAAALGSTGCTEHVLAGREAFGALKRRDKGWEVRGAKCGT